jgi:hypothetical protein
MVSGELCDQLIQATITACISMIVSADDHPALIH